MIVPSCFACVTLREICAWKMEKTQILSERTCQKQCESCKVKIGFRMFLAISFLLFACMRIEQQLWRKRTPSQSPAMIAAPTSTHHGPSIQTEIWTTLPGHCHHPLLIILRYPGRSRNVEVQSSWGSLRSRIESLRRSRILKLSPGAKPQTVLKKVRPVLTNAVAGARRLLPAASRINPHALDAYNVQSNQIIVRRQRRGCRDPRSQVKMAKRRSLCDPLDHQQAETLLLSDWGQAVIHWTAKLGAGRHTLNGKARGRPSYTERQSFFIRAMIVLVTRLIRLLGRPHRLTNLQCGRRGGCSCHLFPGPILQRAMLTIWPVENAKQKCSDFCCEDQDLQGGHPQDAAYDHSARMLASFSWPLRNHAKLQYSEGNRHK